MIRIVALFLAASASGQSLPGTKPLPPEPQAGWSADMVAGIDRMADRLLAAAPAKRAPDRTKLAAALGIELAPPSPGRMVLTGEGSIKSFSLEVTPGVFAEGVLHGTLTGPWVLLLPDADDTVEAAVSRHPAPAGGTLVAMQLISRGVAHSEDSRTGMRAHVSHREWIYRQAFVQGVSVPGLEVDAARALVGWIHRLDPQASISLIGEGEGGHVGLHLVALDERITRAALVGFFGPRESLWSEPIDRNLCGILRDFGAAELASMVAPRPLVVIPKALTPWEGVPRVPNARVLAAPGRIPAVSESDARSEALRAQRLRGGDWLRVAKPDADPMTELFGPNVGATAPTIILDPSRQQRLVSALTRHLQARFDLNDTVRQNAFWKRVPPKPADYPAFVALERRKFEQQVIGRLPDPDVPANVRSRLVRETDRVRVHEVMMDVWQGVPAWGWLAVPKDIPPGERRPVVVCQHGLEGLPEDVLNDRQDSAAYKPYRAFALRLAERGYVTFSPHNPYRGGDAFRVLQRKLQPLGLSLYSVINGQHRRILEWLGGLPEADPARIAFYGLSYGGKSAMRTPAVLDGYCLSICSGDFNEWVRKVGSTSMPMSYVRTHEYEIPEWNLGGTYNYAEMAALIAPRPFMVERGHADGVGLDEWVDHEFAKVRRHYVRIGRPGDAVIEHFDGGHWIHGVGTFEFLRRHLGR